jgi:hypothetical protein
MFSDLLQLFSHDILRIGLAAYGDLLEHYRVFFRIAVTLWVLSIAFDALQSDASFRPVVIRFLRGAVVIAYLAEPAVPRAFVELLAAPADSSGILVGHVLKSTGGTADFGASLDRLLVDVRARSLDLTQPGLFDIDLMGYLVVLFIYVLLLRAIRRLWWPKNV